MARAEAFARENLCQIALVETTSWQARPFYEKCGYTCIATVPDRPRGHASLTLHERLAPAIAWSGEDLTDGLPELGRGGQDR